jgi:uncharacterized protein YegP (UPF0339 family)
MVSFISACTPAMARSSSPANSTKPRPPPATASNRCAQNAHRDGAFELKVAVNGKHYFVLKASNGQVIGQSQMYANRANAEGGGGGEALRQRRRNQRRLLNAASRGRCAGTGKRPQATFRTVQP